MPSQFYRDIMKVKQGNVWERALEIGKTNAIQGIMNQYFRGV